MTDAEQRAMRTADHETLASIRFWLRWIGFSGLFALGGLIWFAAQGWQQIERNAEDVRKLQEAMIAVERRESTRDLATARIDERLGSVQSQLARIERALERIARTGGE